MILTLYKNTQKESDDGNIYTDLWQMETYSPSSMFCEGFTSEEGKFILPDEYSTGMFEGKKVICKGTGFYNIVNTQEGKPALKIIGGTCVSLVLQKEGETPQASNTFVKPQKTERKSAFRDEDYYNEDGSLNIW